ncbi:MAG: calcium/sodium antiporter [Candidatus Magasanikbacteria bacterium]|nr:calcium/sodium antiporter [Candidatus Magasanikbacteria bacterium]
MIIPAVLITTGLAILLFGGEILVRGSASLAKIFKIPNIVIGLTVVAFGTSMPELIVNIFSAIKGSTEIAIGNVIGSNIANILLILGIASIILPLKVKSATTWKEIPMALLAAILILIMGNDAFIDGKITTELSRSDGLALLAFFIIFLYYTFGIAKGDHGKTDETEGDEIKLYSKGKSILFTLAGIIALFIGGKILVDNAIILARLAGLSELLIGATIVAVGTSLPELITSILAAIHKHDDIAVGNVVGSNIFNIFWILGLTATMQPLAFAPSINVDIAANVAATMFLFAFMFIHDKHRINRWQGILFILMYIGYLSFVLYRG